MPHGNLLFSWNNVEQLPEFQCLKRMIDNLPDEPERIPEAVRQLIALAGMLNGIDLEIACKGNPPWELAAV